MNQQNTLIIFVKNEEAGKVKTRLAKSVGDDIALEVYRKLLAYTANITSPLKAKKEVWYSRFIPENDLWSDGNFNKKVQMGEDLGQRMSNAFQLSFEDGAQKAVIIGSDCGELTSAIMGQAFEALDDAEFVVGPAEDGGYYLLGMKNFHPEIFGDIEWSTGSVLEKTLAKMKEAGRPVHQLEKLNDVDTIEDWERVKEKF
ncbi:MAG: glycosyltransferase [Balneola sp.]|nr:glycosyltransferase [Balneola sp.]|tara:strand:+ start:48213 stop:48812 length:600 start_codon:yes stop_codon:yes gene_type:complete